MGINDWAQGAQGNVQAGQTPVSWSMFQQKDTLPYWTGNTLQIPGLAGLLQAGVQGANANTYKFSGPGTGGASGGAGTGQPATQGGAGGSFTGVGTGGGGLGGLFPAQALYNQYPDVLQAYNNLRPEDYAWIEKKGYDPTYQGFAEYWYNTYKPAGFSWSGA